MRGKFHIYSSLPFWPSLIIWLTQYLPVVFGPNFVLLYYQRKNVIQINSPRQYDVTFTINLILTITHKRFFFLLLYGCFDPKAHKCDFCFQQSFGNKNSLKNLPGSRTRCRSTKLFKLLTESDDIFFNIRLMSSWRVVTFVVLGRP